jgi:hypothetical protein
LIAADFLKFFTIISLKLGMLSWWCCAVAITTVL